MRDLIDAGDVHFALFDAAGRAVPVRPAVDGHVVSLSLTGRAVLYSGAEYRIALNDAGGLELTSFEFSAPKLGSIACSVQFGPVEACAVVLNRRLDANVFAHGMESVRRLFPMLSADSQPVLLCVSQSGVTVVDCDRDILLLPAERCQFCLVYPGMSDALVADLVLSLPSQAAFDGAMAWFRQNGGTIGPLTSAASLERTFEHKHVFPE